MDQQSKLQRRAEAATAFDEQQNRSDGAQIAGSLADGLNLLCDLFYTRIHVDVEDAFGMDSMLIPVSPVKTELNTKREINLYQIVESAQEARTRGYVAGDDAWYVNWLAQLLMDAADDPAIQSRFDQYLDKSHQDRRRTFAVVMQRAMPEASRAPLIVYRLLPLAIAGITAVAFGDHPAALELRKRQAALLPGIADCQHCRGNVLENGDRCAECGNPLWKFEWLTAE